MSNIEILELAFNDALIKVRNGGTAEDVEALEKAAEAFEQAIETNA